MIEEGSPRNLISITKAEAMSAHVDDMLKRQMSMRGEPGVAHDRRRKWYLQNWFVLALAGMLGAFLAWAIIEPYYEDEFYLQGRLSEVEIADAFSNEVTLGSKTLELPQAIVGSCRINGQKILLLESLWESEQGQSSHVDLLSLNNGDPVGMYVVYHEGPQSNVALATYLVRSPPPQSPDRAALTMKQQVARSTVASWAMFPVVAGLIGLMLGAVDGIVCRLPRRALLAGAVGLFVGLVGGFILHVVANVVYQPMNAFAMRMTAENGSFGALGFLVQLVGRSMAWGLIGMAMGLGQGIALRSGRLLAYGIIGGLLGGLFGGLMFDPIDLILLGAHQPSAHWSRLVGFLAIGIGVGGMIGIVELLARDAWLRMTQGPLTGKEFLVFKSTMTIGSSPRSDLYLFNDPKVARHHATIRAIGDEVEIEARDSAFPVLLNNHAMQRSRLRHGDNITVGRATFVFQRRKS